jgi:hypothetical protein
MAVKSRPDRDGPVIDDEQDLEVARRLVVDLTRKSAQDVGWLLKNEEGDTNKTTVVNRALQVYRAVMEAQASGRRIMFAKPDGSDAEVIWII